MEVLPEVDALAPAGLSRSTVVGDCRDRLVVALEIRIVDGDHDGTATSALGTCCLGHRQWHWREHFAMPSALLGLHPTGAVVAGPRGVRSLDPAGPTDVASAVHLQMGAAERSHADQDHR